MTGLWKATVAVADISYSISLDLRQSGESLYGAVTSPLGVLTLSNGPVSGNAFHFNLPVDLGSGPTEVAFSGTVAGDSITGESGPGGLNGAAFQGRRVP
ncbi:MAG TPA: hypothetical protein VMN76_09995 [Acidobacteriota bacterium]|nr:hypothetical protein [Acidobacteriota bacterium]